MSYECAIVIGASSGIGAELVKQLADEGCRVAAVARRRDRLDALAAKYPGKVLAFSHDVHCVEQVPELFQTITGELGGLDLFIYAAGVMPRVGAREFSFDKDREMLEVNVIGAIAWLDEAAQRFDHVGHGTLLAIGSRAGERGLGGMPVYCTTKAAIATYMEALRNRLSKRGIRVITVKPGPVATEMTADDHIHGALPAKEAARRILQKSHRTGEHFLKFSDRVICAIVRGFPSPIFRKLGK